MLVGHFDDSGLDERSGSLWLAGYVARMEYWFEFSRSWNQALARHRVRALHTTDLVNSRGAFAGWTPDDQRSLLDDLISVINSSNLVGIGAGIVKADYQRLVVDSGFLKGVGLTEAWWKHPYLLVFQHLVVEVIVGMRHLPASERINFIFEEQNSYAFRCRRVFSSMSNFRVWPRGDRLGSVDFSPKACSTPLQAADLLAYELRRKLDRHLTEPAAPARKSMERLRKHLAASPYLTAGQIPAFLEEVRKSRGDLPDDTRVDFVVKA